MIFKHSAYTLGAADADVVINSPMQNGSIANNINKIAPYNYASLEPGTYNIDNPRPLLENSISGLGFSSTVLSAAIAGAFTNPIKFTISFSSAIDFSGISFSANATITGMIVKEYRGENLIKETTFGEGNTINYFHTDSKLINKVEISILAINLTERFLDIYAINFGKVFNFTDDMIKDVKMVNKFIVSGRELPIDTLEFNLIPPPAELLIDKQQKLELINDEGLTEYTFFVNSWNYSDTNNSVKITYNDCVSLLESEFLGDYYTGKSVAELVDEILRDTGLTHVVESGMHDVTGYIPITTKRNALVYVANATGCKIIKHPFLRLIHKKENVLKTFEDDSVFLGSKTTAEMFTKGINLSVFSYEQGTTSDGEKEVVFEGTLPPGKHFIKFDKPIWTANADVLYPAMIPSLVSEIVLKANSVKVWANETTYFKVEAYPLNSQSHILINQIANADLYNNYEVQKIDSFTLMGNSQNILQLLFDYYTGKKKTISAKVLWANPAFGYVNILGEKMFVNKITTSFDEVVEIEVE